MEKKIKGFRLIKPEYRSAVNQLTDGLWDAYADNNLKCKGWHFALPSPIKIGIIHEILKKAGVLDLWFEPVYEQQKTIVKMHSSNKDEFEIEIIDGEAWYRPENKHLPKEWIREIINVFNSIIIDTNIISPYAVSSGTINVGCYHGTRKEDWEKVYSLLK